MNRLIRLTRLGALASKLARASELAHSVTISRAALDAYLDDNPDVTAYLDDVEAEESALGRRHPPAVAPRGRGTGKRPNGIVRVRDEDRKWRDDFGDGEKRKLYRGAYYVTIAKGHNLGVVEYREVPDAQGQMIRKRIAWLSVEEHILVRDEAASQGKARKARKAAETQGGAA